MPFYFGHPRGTYSPSARLSTQLLNRLSSPQNTNRNNPNNEDGSDVTTSDGGDIPPFPTTKKRTHDEISSGRVSFMGTAPDDKRPRLSRVDSSGSAGTPAVSESGKLSRPRSSINSSRRSSLASRGDIYAIGTDSPTVRREPSLRDTRAVVDSVPRDNGHDDALGQRRDSDRSDQGSDKDDSARQIESELHVESQRDAGTEDNPASSASAEGRDSESEDKKEADSNDQRRQSDQDNRIDQEESSGEESWGELNEEPTTLARKVRVTRSQLGGKKTPATSPSKKAPPQRITRSNAKTNGRKESTPDEEQNSDSSKHDEDVDERLEEESDNESEFSVSKRPVTNASIGSHRRSSRLQTSRTGKTRRSLRRGAPPRGDNSLVELPAKRPYRRREVKPGSVKEEEVEEYNLALEDQNPEEQTNNATRQPAHEETPVTSPVALAEQRSRAKRKKQAYDALSSPQAPDDSLDETSSGVEEEESDPAPKSDKETDYETGEELDDEDVKRARAETFEAAGRVFELEGTWTDLVSETRRLIRETQQVRCGHSIDLLHSIKTAKRTYDQVGELKRNRRRILPALSQSEDNRVQDVVDEVLRFTSTIGHLLVDDDSTGTDEQRKRKRKRKLTRILDEIAAFAAPWMTRLLRSCLVAHYANDDISLSGMKQLSQLLQSFSKLYEATRPIKAHIRARRQDHLITVRALVGILSRVFKYEVSRVDNQEDTSLIIVHESPELQQPVQRQIGPSPEHTGFADVESSRLQRQETIISINGSPEIQRIQEEIQPNPERRASSHDESPHHEGSESIISVHDEDTEMRDHTSSVEEEEEEEEESDREWQPTVQDTTRFTDTERKALFEGLREFHNEYEFILGVYQDELGGRTRDELEKEARRTRDGALSAAKLTGSKLPPEDMAWMEVV
ncbi:hypothetical protein AJ80_00531 [Polytolypa hystricis UAMH7299]|uniref:Uncharacterized protein n=1 Tax=Polytolypa hystricis (strain UAMH7299) TaxID=1447883 RepID=A0A2B7Z3D4_POLH7|nr:hypothetical protein AJ80_00531 [Polytolypa hystricis UAMH7299]